METSMMHNGTKMRGRARFRKIGIRIAHFQVEEGMANTACQKRYNPNEFDSGSPGKSPRMLKVE
jgi:hypothetical protein